MRHRGEVRQTRERPLVDELDERDDRQEHGDRQHAQEQIRASQRPIGIGVADGMGRGIHERTPSQMHGGQSVIRNHRFRSVCRFGQPPGAKHSMQAACQSSFGVCFFAATPSPGLWASCLRPEKRAFAPLSLWQRNHGGARERQGGVERFAPVAGRWRPEGGAIRSKGGRSRPLPTSAGEHPADERFVDVADEFDSPDSRGEHEPQAAIQGLLVAGHDRQQFVCIQWANPGQ